MDRDRTSKRRPLPLSAKLRVGAELLGDQLVSVLCLHYPRPREQSMAPGRPRADHPPRGAPLRDPYFIAAGLDWKQIPTWAGHGDVRQTWNRYGHLVPGGEEATRERLDAYLNSPNPTPTVAHTVALAPENEETPGGYGGSEVPLPGFEPGFPP
jgi:hypothetical protein